MSDRVLIADDYDRMRSMLGNCLAARGYAVDLACNGREAVEHAALGGVDLFILDVDMPEVDGLEACRRIRAMPGYDSAPILFVTGLDDEDLYDRALLAGADDFLHKPVEPTELLLRVSSLLRLRDLRQEVQRSLDALVAQHEELAKQAGRRQELAGMIVHDLRSPISAALISARMLLGSEELPVEQRDSAESIVAACDRIHRMVLDIFDLEHARGAPIPAAAPTELWAILESAVREATMRGRADRIVVELERAAVPTEQVLGHGDALRRIFDNLLDNALRHAPTDSTVQVRAYALPGRLGLRFADAGPGVADEHKQRIFEPYVQLTSPDPRSGRGLGLAYVKLAVEAFGGRVWVEDNTPTGAVFCVELLEG